MVAKGNDGMVELWRVGAEDANKCINGAVLSEEFLMEFPRRSRFSILNYAGPSKEDVESSIHDIVFQSGTGGSVYESSNLHYCDCSLIRRYSRFSVSCVVCGQLFPFPLYHVYLTDP